MSRVRSGYADKPVLLFTPEDQLAVVQRDPNYARSRRLSSRSGHKAFLGYLQAHRQRLTGE
jgi:hypothetical protein